MNNESKKADEVEEVDSELNSQSALEKRLGTENIRKLVWSYSLPSIIGMLINALYNVVDRFWVGRMPDIGAEALTGIGICLPFMNVIIGFSQLFGLGATACISVALGRKEKDIAEKFLANNLVCIIITNLILVAVGLTCLEPLLIMFGAESSETANTLYYATIYMRIIMSFSMFNMVGFAMNHPIRGMGNPKRFASTQILGAVTNIVLDPILIFGFNLGIEGAAIATVVAQTVSFVWIALFYIDKNCILKIRRENLIPNLNIIKQMTSIGVSPFLMQILASVVIIILNRSLLYYGNIELGNGSLAVGAYTIISSFILLCLMPTYGINQGMQPIVGYNYGAGNIDRVKAALKWSVLYAVIITTVSWVVIMSFPEFLVSLFNDDPQMVQLATFGTRVALLFFPIVAAMICQSTFFMAIKRANISIFLTLLRQVIVLIPLCLILPIFMGLEGIFYAMPLADLFAFIVTYIFIKREFKILDKKFSKEEK